MNSRDIIIDTDYIQLGKFLKLADIIDSGGSAKYFLADFTVLINGESDQRRGRKLYPNDLIDIEEFGKFRIVKEQK